MGFGIFIFSGCSPLGISQEQERQLIAADPDFADTLKLKNKTDAELAEMRAIYISEKNICESRISALRKELNAKRQEFYSQAEYIKGKLNPVRQKVNSEIAAATEELRSRSKNYQAVKKMFNEAKSALEGKSGYALNAKDKIQWQKRFESLAEEASTMNQEIARSREKLNLLKLKQRSLIQ